MPNPLHSGGFKPNSATVPQNDVNTKPFQGEYSRSLFPMHQIVLDTHHFADITPHFFFNGIAGDSLKLDCNANVHSYTLSSPLLQNLRMHHAYFAVPKKSILPNTYDYLKVPPKIGDDVDASSCNCILNLETVLSFLRSLVCSDVDGNDSSSFQVVLFSFIRLWHCFLSDASLLSRSGISVYDHLLFKKYFLSDFLSDRVFCSSNGSSLTPLDWFPPSDGSQGSSSGSSLSGSVFLSCFGVNPDTLSIESIDDWVEVFFRNVFSYFSCSVSYTFGDHSVTESLNIVSYDSSSKVVSFNISDFRRLCWLVTHFDVTLSSYDCRISLLGDDLSDECITFSDGSDSFSVYPLSYYVSSERGKPGCSIDTGRKLLMVFCSWFGSLFLSHWLSGRVVDGSDTVSYRKYFSSSKVNIERVIAYQLVCAQFFTNDNVDEVNTSVKWLNFMRSFVLSDDSYAGFDVSDLYFYHNNERVPYDVFSSHFINSIGHYDSVVNLSTLSNAISFFTNLLIEQASLTYENYFLSAKTSPLADATVDLKDYPEGTNSGALATVRSLLVTRFLNAVNSLPNSIREYCQKMFGVAPSETSSQPRFIGHSVYNIGSQTIVNTADNQGNQESNIVSSDNKTSFSVDLSDDCIIIGVTYYDLERCYIGVTDRFAFHFDRYDDFQPYLQRIGDQSIYLGELYPNGADSNVVTPDSTPSSFGYVPRFAEYKQMISRAFGGFTSSAVRNWANAWLTSRDGSRINDLILRNENRDLDRFYKSLSGCSPSSYFHFILSIQNSVLASRPIEYKSNVLMP